MLIRCSCDVAKRRYGSFAFGGLRVSLTLGWWLKFAAAPVRLCAAQDFSCVFLHGMLGASVTFDPLGALLRKNGTPLTRRPNPRAPPHQCSARTICEVPNVFAIKEEGR